MTETLTYIIRNKATGKTIECHDEVSKDHAYRMVEVHNSIYKGIYREQWEIVVEML